MRRECKLKNREPQSRIPQSEVMITDSEHTSTLYPDGKKHKATDENGDKISTKTEWQ